MYLDYIYIYVLSCFYDRLSEEYTTIIGGDFNVDITNEDTNLKGKSVTNFLNALTSKLPVCWLAELGLDIDLEIKIKVKGHW